MKLVRMFTILVLALALMVCWTATSLGKKPVTSEFTYHGRLSRHGGPASGLYDFRGILFDDPCEVADVNRIGPVLEVNDVDVHGGQFQLRLDFGNDPNVFSGDKRWLVIEVRRSSANDANDVNDVYDVNDYTVLEPRIELTAAPYASTAVRISGKKVVKKEHLEDKAVGRDKIEDGAVDHKKIDHKAVKKEHIDDRAVDPNKIERKAVKREHIEDRAVDPNKIAWKAVKKEHIQDKAVGRDKIEDRAVDPNKLDDGAVTSSKIADGSVKSRHMAQNMAQEGQVMKWNGNLWAPADDLTGVSAWTVSDSNVYSAVSGNVGIGTDSPAAKLTVAGAILRDGSTMHGANASTHINLGTDSTTGMDEQNSTFATVGGGLQNRATDHYATVGGGRDNVAGGYHASVGGGLDNIAGGSMATVPGGSGNRAQGHVSFAAGYRAWAYHDGCFVWADSNGPGFASTDEDQFLIRASGGVGIGTTIPMAQLTVKAQEGGAGVYGYGEGENAKGVHGRVFGAENSFNTYGVYGENANPGGGGAGVYGKHDGSGTGVHGHSYVGHGVMGVSSGPDDFDGAAVLGSNSNRGTGVYGMSSGGTGVYGRSSGLTGSVGVHGEHTGSGGTGVRGDSDTGNGVHGATAGGVGVYGASTGSSGIGVRGENSHGGLAGYFEGRTAVAGRLCVSDTGPTPTPAEALHVEGKAYIAEMDPVSTQGFMVRWWGNRLCRSSSSAKYKDDIQPLEASFDRILRAEPRSFTGKTTGERGIGFIAEEFDALGLKDLVIYEDGQAEGVRYELVGVYLLEVLKQQVRTTDELKAENQSLKQRIEALERAVTGRQLEDRKEVDR